MAEVIVKVRGKERTIEVQRTANGKYVATGRDIYNEPLSAEGRSERAAIGAWRDQAEYHNK